LTLWNAAAPTVPLFSLKADGHIRDVLFFDSISSHSRLIGLTRLDYLYQSRWVQEIHRVILHVGITINALRVVYTDASLVRVRTGPPAASALLLSPICMIQSVLVLLGLGISLARVIRHHAVRIAVALADCARACAGCYLFAKGRVVMS
jgi:hypothetical protein